MDVGRRFVLSVALVTILSQRIAASSAAPDNVNTNCDPVLIACPCGRSSSAVQVVRVQLKTCYDEQLVDKKPPCLLCDGHIGQTAEDKCSKYRHCATCGEGLNQCLTCPSRKYGKWCDKVCECYNDGACDPDDGSCLCPRGFSGKRCELTVQLQDVMLNNGHRLRVFRRQITDSVTCPVLPPPSNGEIHMEATVPTLNDAVKYTCKDKFTMIGSSARHCLRTGQWAGEAPTCEKLCPYPVVDPYVKVAINPERAGAPHLTTLGVEILAELIFSCEFGFVLIGSPRMRCASGIWDQEVPKCVPDPECADPGHPANGERFVVRAFPVKESYKIGTQLFFNCTESNYTLVGSENITCMPFAQWSAPIPVCVPNVISDCVYECKTASSSILNVAERPLICSLESHEDTHVILRPRGSALGVDGNT